MTTKNVKSDLKSIAEKLAPDASYADAMYELYVRMKIADGKKAAGEGRVVLHEDVKKKYSR